MNVFRIGRLHAAAGEYSYSGHAADECIQTDKQTDRQIPTAILCIPSRTMYHKNLMTLSDIFHVVRLKQLREQMINNTKFKDLKSDSLRGHASRPHNNIDMHLALISCRAHPIGVFRCLMEGTFRMIKVIFKIFGPDKVYSMQHSS